ncbi:MAG: molybdopterin cofactor-binding domain-containing protein [Acetobacteraceae bacterium]
MASRAVDAGSTARLRHDADAGRHRDDGGRTRRGAGGRSDRAADEEPECARACATRRERSPPARCATTRSWSGPRAHPLWHGRAARKQAYEAAHPGRRYGVGFAMVHKDYGSGAEAAVATLELLPSGGLALRQGGNDMGTGMTTAHAVMVQRILGRAPSRAQFGVTDWPEMKLVSTEEPYTLTQAREDELSRNPRWTPSFPVADERLQQRLLRRPRHAHRREHAAARVALAGGAGVVVARAGWRADRALAVEREDVRDAGRQARGRRAGAAQPGTPGGGGLSPSTCLPR